MFQSSRSWRLRRQQGTPKYRTAEGPPQDWVLSEVPQVDTVSDMLQTADKVGCAALRKECLNFMVEHTEQVHRTAGFRMLVKNKPEIMMDLVALMAQAQEQRTDGGAHRLKKPRIEHR